MEDWAAEMEADLPLYVRICKLGPCKSEDWVNLVPPPRRSDPRAFPGARFRQPGATAQTGAAPSGYLEEEISAWIGALKS
eukprot:5094637-Pyramimonas_sp.AAC.1